MPNFDSSQRMQDTPLETRCGQERQNTALAQTKTTYLTPHPLHNAGMPELYAIVNVQTLSTIP